MNIVGIAGLPRSGKDTLAELFIKSGYYGVSLGDIVRDEARARHSDKLDPISLTNMTETSNYLRQSFGSDFALKKAIEKYQTAQKTKTYKGLAVYSIRAPIEADFILSKGGKLIWVETKDEIRHNRNNQNLRPGEVPVTLEEFVEQEKLQWKPNPSLPQEIQMNIEYVKSCATDVIENNGHDVTEFFNRSKAVFKL